MSKKGKDLGVTLTPKNAILGATVMLVGGSQSGVTGEIDSICGDKILFKQVGSPQLHRIYMDKFLLLHHQPNSAIQAVMFAKKQMDDEEQSLKESVSCHVEKPVKMLRADAPWNF